MCLFITAVVMFLLSCFILVYFLYTHPYHYTILYECDFVDTLISVCVCVCVCACVHACVRVCACVCVSRTNLVFSN